MFLIQILLWKMNQPSLGFFPEALLTNFVQNSQADPAQQCDGGRQDLLTFGWRQGKTVLRACLKNPQADSAKNHTKHMVNEITGRELAWTAGVFQHCGLLVSWPELYLCCFKQLHI